MAKANYKKSVGYGNKAVFGTGDPVEYTGRGGPLRSYGIDTGARGKVLSVDYDVVFPGGDELNISSRNLRKLLSGKEKPKIGDAVEYIGRGGPMSQEIDTGAKGKIVSVNYNVEFPGNEEFNISYKKLRKVSSGASKAGGNESIDNLVKAIMLIGGIFLFASFLSATQQQAVQNVQLAPPIPSTPVMIIGLLLIVCVVYFMATRAFKKRVSIPLSFQ